MYRQQWIGIVVGILLASAASAQTQRDTDELTLKSNKMPIDGKGLLAYFEAGALKQGDAIELPALVKKLGSDVYREREPAAKALVKRGSVALPFLRAALATSPLEMKRRAEQCIRDIEATMQAEVIAAAARVLAAHKEPKAAEALFNFLPSISTDPFLEEEVLASVGRLTITPDGKVDPLLLNALKDPLPFRRNVAAYLIGRRAGTEHRDKLRALLGDPDPLVRERVVHGLYGKRATQALLESAAGDETLLKSQKIDPSEKALFKFFQDLTLSDADQRRLRGYVKDLGDSSYSIRERAQKDLIKKGPSVLSFLREVEYDSNVELSRRARMCLDNIRDLNKPSVPIAAAHLLTRIPAKQEAAPAEIVRMLLAYAPFVDDDAVEEELLTCLTLLSLREPTVEPALLKALEDPSTLRRAAAAYVLGHVGTKEQVAKVQPLLDDLQPIVRLRAAQGLLAARNKIALPSFINLIGNAPAPYLPRIEEVLYRVAQDTSPNESIQGGSPEARAKAVRAWDKWLKDNEAKVDLTSINDRESYLGLVTVAEYDNQMGNNQGSVWEATRGGPKRFTFTGVMGAMDAHTLPNGRVLVAENINNQISERDSKGTILWSYRTPVGNPVCCQRLPNGNTFIATYNALMEITPNKTEVYRIVPGPQFFIFSAHKARNGQIVAITGQGQIIHYEAPTAGQNVPRQIRTVQTNTQGNWCSVELLQNGNYLVGAMSGVKEIDTKGTEIWGKQPFAPNAGLFRATRLPNGNVLVAAMNTREVAEIDRAGTVRWKVNTPGRPWAVHYR